MQYKGILEGGEADTPPLPRSAPWSREIMINSKIEIPGAIQPIPSFQIIQIRRINKKKYDFL